MGFAAGLMAFRPDMEGIEKVFCLMILFTLLISELNAIRADRFEQNGFQKFERESFTKLIQENAKLNQDNSDFRAQNQEILKIVRNPPPKGMTTGEAVAKYLNGSYVPPVSNAELRSETSAYTTQIRDLSLRQKRALESLTTKPGDGHTYMWKDKLPEHRREVKAFFGVQLQGLRAKGTSLCKELRKRVHETKPAKEMKVLENPNLETPADQSWSSLATYMDSLAERLPFP